MTQPSKVTQRQRLIESKVMFETFDVSGGDVRILQVRREWAARHLVENTVNDHADDDHQGDRLKSAPDGVDQHRAFEIRSESNAALDCRGRVAASCRSRERDRYFFRMALLVA